MMRFSIGFALLSLIGTAAMGAERPSSPLRSAGPAGHRLPRCQEASGGSGLLPDGDFQSMPDIGPYYSEYFSGEPFAKGWRVTKGSVDFNGSTGWGPASPNNACTIDMDGIDPGGLATKPFPTTPNAQYTVAFLFSGNGGEAPTKKRLMVEAAGQSQLFIWDDANGDAEDGDWTTESWTFTAAATMTTLAFISHDPKTASRGPVIGDVSVTAN